MITVLVILYAFSLAFIFVFSLVQLHLTFSYRKKTGPDDSLREVSEWPMVTIQLPVYNEKYVIERLLRAATSLDYPKDLLQVQVLDDSNDETSDVIDRLKREGLEFDHVRRPDRKGFKAGALQYGLSKAKGEFIAVFDADFVPSPDFLYRTIPNFMQRTGLVQTRWGHLNKNYSLLTKLQAFGLDAHFTVEQTGRSKAGSYISFNGTGGIWRKACIIDAGGWSSDTLTEDLDLSYRAQLKNWEFEYLEDYEAPAELPVIMPAIKSQQYRWNKGAAETARKLLPSVLRSPGSFTRKLHATFHLLNSSVFIFLFLAAILSIPMLYVKHSFPVFEWVFIIGSVFLAGFFSITYFYWVANKKSSGKISFLEFGKSYFLFLIVSMGLSLHNGWAVLQGLIGFKTSFIRTPKFNIVGKKGEWKRNQYLNLRLSTMTILEGLLAVYFLFGIWYGISIRDYGLLLFHSMLALGFSMVFIYSLIPIRTSSDG